MEKIINCENACKRFGENEIIKNLSLSADRNEFIAVVGPGRSGKTTLINLLSGLETADSGVITVNGETVDRPSASRGVVFQTTLLFPWMTVMGNVAYGPRSQGMSRRKSREKAEKYIKLVGLEGFEHAYPVQLSGGMKQRVGIARVYCSGPEVIFMDEPFGHLDAQTRYLMQEELERVWQSEKKTVVFVTNNIEEAVYLADRVLVMTNCPAHIKAEFRIDLPRPRSYMDSAFLEYRRVINAVIDPTE